MKQPYHLKDYTCPKCQSKGPFLLDTDDAFTYCDDGTLRFPEGAWGLEIGCDCSACGFVGDLESFVEWVEVIGEEREACIREIRRLHGPFLVAAKQAQRELFEQMIAGYGSIFAESAVMDLLFESMQWADRHGHSFRTLLRKATRRHRDAKRQKKGGVA
jgi:hypothetical protein